MNAAIHAVREGDVSYYKAAATYDIPEATLRRYLRTDEEVCKMIYIYSLDIKSMYTRTNAHVSHNTHACNTHTHT